MAGGRRLQHPAMWSHEDESASRELLPGQLEAAAPGVVPPDRGNLEMSFWGKRTTSSRKPPGEREEQSVEQCIGAAQLPREQCKTRIVRLQANEVLKAQDFTWSLPLAPQGERENKMRESMNGHAVPAG
jgi:hypothetical protein